MKRYVAIDIVAMIDVKRSYTVIKHVASFSEHLTTYYLI